MDGEAIELPSLIEIKDGVRKYPRTAFIFFEFFLPGVVGKMKMKK